MTITPALIAEAQSVALFNRAKAVTTGGVTAAGRFNPVLGRPYYFERGDGCRLWDIDGNEYIDFSSSNGASMLGFNHPAINEAAQKAIELGTITTQETEYHIELAERLTRILPGAERVRFSNTGTEATMAAVRIARAHTGREKILKFDGHFHGMHDYVLFNAHTPERVYEHFVPSFPDSAGIPKALKDLVVTIPFNDAEALEDAIDVYGHEIAAVILEPISYNLGTIPANREWLRLLRRLTEDAGIVLIFDEVLAGFRTTLGGSAEYFGVTPDLSTWAKALAAGWPLAAITGSAEVMSSLNPVGGAVVSGTYTGHLAAVLASLAALDVMSAPGFYTDLNAKGEKFYAGVQDLFAKHGVPGHIRGIGARFGLYFGINDEVTDYRQARKFDADLNNWFLSQTAPNGLHFHDFGTKAAPMHYGITAAHTDEDLAEALARLDNVFAAIS
ncbi:aspartate aminotransferase family protein [Streptomyces shenzhenensis]|uniref:aspartate aminotransferase family protein n=1 Tax=Streptomyces shenzhenensis TaxID=943815 RepID=UPI00382A1FD6